METSTQPNSNNDYDWDYVIVGGGCMGCALALALKQKYPEARVLWYKGITRTTASGDRDKIIRTPYPHQGYINWAKCAMSKWKTDGLHMPFFEEPGWIQVVSEGSQRSSMVDKQDSAISSEAMQEMVGSRHRPVLEPGETLFLNKSIGRARYASALEAVAQKASSLGVERHDEDVLKLSVQNGICTGVEVPGKTVKAKKTIVAAGPWTPGLLQNSGVAFPDNFFKVVAIAVAIMDLTDAELKELQRMPILVTDKGEIMVSEQHQSLKITSTNSFEISHPDRVKEKLPDIECNRALLAKLLPQFAQKELKGWYCVDLMSPHEHPLMDMLPGVENLYLAAGGNFHCAKFLPEGDVMLSVLESREQGEKDVVDPNTILGFLLEKCGWDRAGEDVGAHSNLVPKVRQ